MKKDSDVFIGIVQNGHDKEGGTKDEMKQIVKN